MPIPIHYAHVYQKPKQGTHFLKRYPAYSYQHTITNMGWFDTASFDIAVYSETEGQDILNAYLGNLVQIYVDNPKQPIWEGIINRMTFNNGLSSYTISLDEMANRVSIVITGAANAGAETAVVNNTASQAIYGVKQDQIEFGADPTGGGAGSQRVNLRDTILSQRAFPQSSYSQAQGSTNLVHLEMIGMFHTLEWEKLFTALVGTTTAFSTAIINLIATIANGSTFFLNSDTSQIVANAGTTPDQQRGVSVWDRIMKIAEAGDGTNYWIVGISPTDPNRNRRMLYYRQANAVIGYTAHQGDGLKPRNLYGKLIPPWSVVPDVGIRVTDVLVGYGGTIQTSPREAYIQSIQYDANSQQVQWFGADDTTARAAFQLKRAYKPLSKNMPGSAPLRTLVT